jgi:hypothetical protein
MAQRDMRPCQPAKSGNKNNKRNNMSASLPVWITWTSFAFPSPLLERAAGAGILDLRAGSVGRQGSSS